MLLGNHRDAWAFGAADASSGTAALIEISKKLGELKAEGDVNHGNIAINCTEIACVFSSMFSSTFLKRRKLVKKIAFTGLKRVMKNKRGSNQLNACECA